MPASVFDGDGSSGRVAHLILESLRRAVRFARWVFLLAGIAGLIEIAPLYLLENLVGQRQPPPITHPLLYYGFVGLALAWQIAFLIISRNPLRYRPLMPAIFLKKLLYPLCMVVLHLPGRFPASALAPPLFDLIWLALVFGHG